MLKLYKDGDDIEGILKVNRVFFIQYGKNSCSPCLSIKEKINKWMENRNDADGIYIDIDKYKTISAQKGVFVTPAVDVYFEGKLIEDKRGYFSLDEILDRLEGLISIG